MTIAQIKDLFQTGKIPTQADFENLINKIPNSELTWGRDNTLKLYNPSAPYVWGYRFVAFDDNCTYIFLGVYDASNGIIVPYIILEVIGNRPLEGGACFRYTILNDAQLLEMNSILSGASMHDVPDNTLVNAIPATCQWNYIGNTFVKTVYIDQSNEFHTFTFNCVKTKVAWDLATDIREIYVPTTCEWFASNIQGLVTYHKFGVLKGSANLIDLSKDLFTQDFGMTYDVCTEICDTYFDVVKVSTI